MIESYIEMIESYIEMVELYIEMIKSYIEMIESKIGHTVRSTITYIRLLDNRVIHDNTRRH